MTNTTIQDQRAENDQHVLERYACRWAVLAAWHDDLNRRSIALPPGINEKIDLAHTKIASGCFSVCEVGCNLGQIEALFTSTDASSQQNAAENWIDLLAKAMDDSVGLERVLRIPAVKFQFVNCKLPCKCGP